VCRDISFDPLILPTGIEPSADPLLQARADAYAESLRRRLQDETKVPKHTPAQTPRE
jgi:catalase